LILVWNLLRAHPRKSDEHEFTSNDVKHLGTRPVRPTPPPVSDAATLARDGMVPEGAVLRAAK